MVARSKYRGHPMHFDESREAWVFDDGALVRDWPLRPCGYCNRPSTSEGHDGCLGTLPGVINACCGHGDINDAYVQLVTGERLSGNAAVQFFTRSHDGRWVKK